VPFLAVEGAVDDIAGVGPRRRQLTIEIRVVFNDKQAQAGLRKLSRQDRRHPDEASRREYRMNSNRFASLLFLHNRVAAPVAAQGFATPTVDPNG
jgi:hypothetical protein